MNYSPILPQAKNLYNTLNLTENIYGIQTTLVSNKGSQNCEGAITTSFCRRKMCHTALETLMSYFKIVRTPIKVCADIRHTISTQDAHHFFRNFPKIISASLVCHMCTKSSEVV